MTDLHTYTSTSGTRLSIRLREQDVLAHGSTRLFLGVDDSGMFIPTADLLAVIDAADPDAMRAYLRETLAAERLDAIPEADSPEDVDERVPPREALLTDAQERRLYIIEQLTKTLPADETPALAHWIITGGMDQLEDLTLSGESLNR